MPRATRNSWVDLDIDGRRTSVHTGPRASEGTMRAQFHVRDKGQVIKSVAVETFMEFGGRLTLRVKAPDGRVILTHTTARDDGNIRDTDRGVLLRVPKHNDLTDWPGGPSKLVRLE